MWGEARAPSVSPALLPGTPSVQAGPTSPDPDTVPRLSPSPSAPPKEAVSPPTLCPLHPLFLHPLLLPFLTELLAQCISSTSSWHFSGFPNPGPECVSGSLARPLAVHLADVSECLPHATPVQDAGRRGRAHHSPYPPGAPSSEGSCPGEQEEFELLGLGGGERDWLKQRLQVETLGVGVGWFVKDGEE